MCKKRGDVPFALRTTALWSERRYLDLSLLEPKEVEGSLTEASRSFLSLLHTTRDLTVNNAILLVDHINRMRGRPGLSFQDAVVRGRFKREPG